MRVLVTTPDFPPDAGGIQLLVHRLAAHLRADVTVVAFAQSGSEAIDRAIGADVVRVPRAVSHRAGVVLLNTTTLATARRTKPDAIVSAHIVAGLGALGARRAVRAPVVQYAHAKELGVRPQLARQILPRADA